VVLFKNDLSAASTTPPALMWQWLFQMPGDPERGCAVIFSIPHLPLVINLLPQKYEKPQQVQLCGVWPTHYEF